MLNKRLVEIKDKQAVESMRRSALILQDVMGEVGSRVKPGVTTKELDRLAQKMIEQEKATPAFLGYRGFPATLCTSINEEVVHGIPSDKRRLEEGDIVSIDCGLVLNGYYADMARTFAVGTIGEELQKLLDTTWESLNRAIETMRVGKRLGDLGRAVDTFASGLGYGVVRQYTGHGIGRQMHESPQVPNYFDPANNMRFQPGMVLAIEPMINLGDWRCRELGDGWTVVTEDGKPSAHFEDTIAVTEDEPFILTRKEGKLA